MNQVRSPSVHPLTYGVAFILVCSLCLLNTYPRVQWGSIDLNLYEEEFMHGWPVVYMRRDWHMAKADMGGMFHDPWPISSESPVRFFRIGYLVLDVIVAVLLVVLTIMPINSFLRSRHVRIQFSLSLMLTIIAMICLLLAAQQLVQLHIYVLHVLPNSIVLLSLAYVCLSFARHAFRLCATAISKTRITKI